jgi:TolA-binding protein
MADETQSSPKPAAPVQGADSPTGDRREFAELRKEVVEARNLVIKTDNQLKNMYAELKRVSDKQDEFARRRFFSSATAYVLFTVLTGVLFYSLSRADASRASESAAAAEARSRDLTQKVEAAQKGEKTRREASDRAARVFEQLGSEKEIAGLSQAMSNAGRIDRAQLSELEAAALDVRVASAREKIAQTSLERGLQAVRHNDHAAVSTELGRYLEAVSAPADPTVWFHLGFSRAQLKDYARAVEPLERFLKVQQQGRQAQAAGYWLGLSLEETGAAAKAVEAYNRAVALFPGNETAVAIRARLKRLGSGAPQSPAAPAPARPPPAPAPAPSEPKP